MEISRVAYELYKQDWIDRHTTPEMRLQSLRDYFDYLLDCAELDYDGDPYEEWLDEAGFSGSLYASYGEFCDGEYHDVEYIKSLLSAGELSEMYCRDVGVDYVEASDLDDVLDGAFAKARVAESFESDFEFDM